MANLSVDTAKLSESGQDIISLSTELKEELDALFSRITNMNTKTFEWVGGASNEFIRRTNIEKIQYMKVVNTLKNYGKILTDAALEYESVSKR